MTSWTIREAWSDSEFRMGSLAAWARGAVFAALAGLWMGALGPFGNYYAGPLAARLTFHLALMAINVAGLGLAIRLALWSGREFDVGPWVSIPLATIIACLPLSAMGALLGTALFPQLRHILSPFDWYFETLLLLLPIVCAYVGALFFHHARTAAAPRQRPIVPPDPPPFDIRPRLAYRLSASVDGEILALNAEDHYVRIHTGSGSQLVLMRLSDAIEEMDEVDGFRTHRSWWVSRSAVTKLKLAGREGRLTLRGGLQVPVARSALAHLRGIDWCQMGNRQR